MSSTTHPQFPPLNNKDTERFRARLSRLGEEAQKVGLPAEAAEALLGIDASLFALRRRHLKGEMVRTLLAELDSGLEQAEFEGLTAVARMLGGMGTPPRTDITIGDIAAELNIDPSRASRLVTALVQKDYLLRDVSQQDARKTVLRPTTKSETLFHAFMKLKWRVVLDAFSGWSLEEIETFETLLSRYIGAMDEALPAERRTEAQVPAE